jgi:hypothetical protein
MTDLNQVRSFPEPSIKTVWRKDDKDKLFATHVPKEQYQAEFLRSKNAFLLAPKDGNDPLLSSFYELSKSGNFIGPYEKNGISIGVGTVTDPKKFEEYLELMKKIAGPEINPNPDNNTDSDLNYYSDLIQGASEKLMNLTTGELTNEQRHYLQGALEGRDYFQEGNVQNSSLRWLVEQSKEARNNLRSIKGQELLISPARGEAASQVAYNIFATAIALKAAIPISKEEPFNSDEGVSRETSALVDRLLDEVRNRDQNLFKKADYMNNTEPTELIQNLNLISEAGIQLEEETTKRLERYNLDLENSSDSKQKLKSSLVKLSHDFRQIDISPKLSLKRQDLDQTWFGTGNQGFYLPKISLNYEDKKVAEIDLGEIYSNLNKGKFMDSRNLLDTFKNTVNEFTQGKNISLGETYNKFVKKLDEIIISQTPNAVLDVSVNSSN